LSNITKGASNKKLQVVQSSGQTGRRGWWGGRRKNHIDYVLNGSWMSRSSENLKSLKASKITSKG
jgi:hypothetical protein